MRSILKIALLLMVTIPVSCKRFANPFAGGDKVLAEVGGEKLYVHDLSSIFTPDMAPEDSVKILGSYVDRWVKMQLKIQEAERMFESSQQDIDRMVEEYRNSLLTHKVDQYYVDKLIDTLFTDSQIGEYYRKNQADFVLDKTLLKARVVRLPRSYGPKNKIKELMMALRQEQFRVDGAQRLDRFFHVAFPASDRQDGKLRRFADNRPGQRNGDFLRRILRADSGVPAARRPGSSGERAGSDPPGDFQSEKGRDRAGA